MSDTKKCPFCAEEIQAAAKKCRYCDEWLEEPSAPTSLRDKAAAIEGIELTDPAEGAGPEPQPRAASAPLRVDHAAEEAREYRSRRNVVWAGVFVVMAMTWWTGIFTPTPGGQRSAPSARSDSPPSARRGEPSDAACKGDLDCWAERQLAQASVRCDDAVERLAKHDHEWTDGWLGTKFTHYRWLNQSAGTLTYAGDSIKFQNGFGAWVPHRYECDFDPASKQVLAARAEPGRLSP